MSGYQGGRIPLLRLLELSFWRWSAIQRYRRRLKPKLTKFLMGDFPNIAISLRFPTSRHSLKKFIGMLHFTSNIHCFPLIVFLDGSLYFHLVGPCSFLTYGNKLDPYLVKAARISRPTMISTMTITSPPTLLLSLTNGNGHLLPINIQLSSFLKTLLL